MYRKELDREINKAIRDMADNLAEVQKGEDVSYEVLEGAIARFSDFTTCKRMISEMPADQQPDVIDDVMKTIRQLRTQKAWNEIKGNIAVNAKVVGQTAAKLGKGLLGGIGKGANFLSTKLDEAAQK